MVKMTITEDKEERLSMETKGSNKKPKMSTKMRQYFTSTLMNKSTNPSGLPTIDVAFDNLIEVDITHINHAKMDMAVATFFI